MADTPQPDPTTGLAPGQIPYSPYPGGQTTLGGGMYPWLSGYNGPFVAGPSPQQTGLYGQFQQTLNAGPGWSPSNTSYQAGRNLGQIQQGAQTLKDYEDQQALKRMQSSAAAGGNALSGALLQNEGDYLRNSGASFNQMMGNLGLQSGLANRGMDIQENLGNAGLANQAYAEQLGGMNSLLGQYNTQQGIQNQGLGLQYADYLRQIQNMQNAYNMPNQLALSMLHSGYPGYQQPQYGNSTLDQVLGGLGQSGGLSSLMNFLFGTNNQNQNTRTGSSGSPGGGGVSGGGGGGNQSGGGSQGLLKDLWDKLMGNNNDQNQNNTTPDNSPTGDVGPNGSPIRTDANGLQYYLDDNGNPVYGSTDDNGNFVPTEDPTGGDLSGSGSVTDWWTGGDTSGGGGDLTNYFDTSGDYSGDYGGGDWGGDMGD